MIKKIYIAGPLFNKHEQMYLEEIAKELEGNGYDCFLPHRDASTGIDESELKDTDMSQETKDIIFKNDLDALDAADLTVAAGGEVVTGGATTPVFLSDAERKKSISVIGKTFSLIARSTTAKIVTQITIIGNETGAVTTVPITVNSNA